ncbi:nitroreductase family deazaflavin-dependent oxidoreductase [Mycobacterium sp. NPDC048908]|uniref:nitroreductase family deazaflavin-dependent oxidoreductase n=1 Tax=Mycobacterium sp. NPDC048908 TaxID=3364292 RepID=UPI003713BA60
MRAVAVVVGTLLGAVVMLFGVLLAGLRWQVGPALDAVRRMNRSVTNPRVMRTAGTPQTQTSVMEHVGRNSGRSYQTPIDVIESPTTLLIALPYGTRADWLRNVQAAGSATVVVQGRRIDVTRPSIVATAEVADRIPKRTMRMLRLFGVGQFLQLEKS